LRQIRHFYGATAVLRQIKVAGMNNQFFEKPILNSPYGYPIRHWELDEAG